MPIRLPFRPRRDSFPPDLWTKCPSCEEMLFNRQLDKAGRVCPNCGHHFRLPAAWGYSHPFTVVPVSAWPHPYPRPSVSDCAVDAVGELTPPTLSAGPVRMDVDRHVVTVAGDAVQLPLKEFELLELLLRNAGRVLTRGQLIDRVWGSDYVGDTKTLDVHVKRLRSKLEADPAEPKLLTTVRGLGDKLDL